MLGRSTTASQAGRPSALSCSICTIKMTELRIRIPINANTPRMATNPSGVPLGSKATTTPTNASERRNGADQKQPALQLDHQNCRHDEKHQGNDGLDRALAFSAFFD
jgi:hypothetical protein